MNRPFKDIPTKQLHHLGLMLQGASKLGVNAVVNSLADEAARRDDAVPAFKELMQELGQENNPEVAKMLDKIEDMKERMKE